MGGECRPDLMPNEVMVARITIASTTQDVTCVHARRGKNRIDSGFYPELETLYRAKSPRWLRRTRLTTKRRRKESTTARFEKDSEVDASALDDMTKVITSGWPAPASDGSQLGQVSRRSHLRRRAMEFFLDKKHLPTMEEAVALMT